MEREEWMGKTQRHVGGADASKRSKYKKIEAKRGRGEKKEKKEKKKKDEVLEIQRVDRKGGRKYTYGVPKFGHSSKVCCLLSHEPSTPGRTVSV